jgi:hypothetical protein
MRVIEIGKHDRFALELFLRFRAYLQIFLDGAMSLHGYRPKLFA